MNNEMFHSLQRLLEYVANDERKDFEANGEPQGHIYQDILILEKYVQRSFHNEASND